MFNAYWQIELTSESKEKTAFTVPGRGLYQFLTMPFGLHNAPANWKRFINNVLGADQETHVFVYLDDIIAVNPSFEKHMEYLEEFSKRLKAAQITINRE